MYRIIKSLSFKESFSFKLENWNKLIPFIFTTALSRVEDKKILFHKNCWSLVATRLVLCSLAHNY